MMTAPVRIAIAASADVVAAGRLKKSTVTASALCVCWSIMIDQHTHSADAVTVDFFNRPAATTSALAAMAIRTGAVIIPVFALPMPDGRFRMIYDHPVERPPADAADPVRD